MSFSSSKITHSNASEYRTQIHVEEVNASVNIISTLSQPRISSLKLSKEGSNNQTNYASILEFASEQTKENTQANIDLIENKEDKVTELKKAVLKGNWNDSLFDQTNPDFIGIEKGEFFEFPFIALYGLQQKIISYQEFFIIQCYYGLRNQFSKEEIHFHAIFQKNRTVNKNTQKLLTQCLCDNLIIEGTRLNFSKDQLQQFFFTLKQHKSLHEMVLFSVKEEPLQEESHTIWNSFRNDDKMSIFSNNDRQFTPSLIAHQIFLRILYPHSHDIKLRARIGFTPPIMQRLRGQGYFDVLTLVPTCYPESIDDFPAPGLQGTHHDLLGHALTVLAISQKWRQQLIQFAENLREFETNYQDKLDDEDLRHECSDIVFNLDFTFYSLFNPGKKAIDTDINLAPLVRFLTHPIKRSKKNYNIALTTHLRSLLP
ncbi:MAG: hypothetical protein V4494_07095 [Chlamydiota bacterium]